MKKDLTYEKKDSSQESIYANSYVMNKRDASSPYVATFLATRNLRIAQEQSRYAYDQYESGCGAEDARTRTIPRKRKGVPLAIIMLILVVAYVAVAALSFFNILPEYTSVFSKNDIILEEEDPILIQNRDIIMGFVKSFMPEMEEASIFYDECMANIAEAEMLPKIAYYAMPIALALGVVVAVVLIILLIVFAAKSSARGGILGLSIFLFLLNVVFVLGGFVWSVGSFNFAEIMKFLPFYSGEEALALVMNYGSLISLGISLLLFVFSLIFMGVSRKKLQ